MTQQLRQAGLQLLDLKHLLLQAFSRGLQFGRMLLLAAQQQRPQGGHVPTIPEQTPERV